MNEQQITLLLIKKDAAPVDIVELIKQVEWSGRKGAAPRTLRVQLVDSSEYDRSGIDVEQGDNLVFYWNGVELFRGMILKQVDKDDRMMDVTAYDLGRYLANNRDNFSYENKTLSYIFKDICNRFEFPIGECAESSYQLDKMSGLTTTPWDVLTDAMLETFKFTGERYYIYVSDERFNLIKRKDSMINWVVESGSNLLGYTRTRDFSDIKTRVKLLGDKDSVLLLEKNEELEKIFGIYQEVEKVDKDTASSKYKQIAQNKLKFDGKPDSYIQITAIGITDCITGATLHLSIDELGISEVYYIDEDTHTFEANKSSELGGFTHQMSLKLRRTYEIQG